MRLAADGDNSMQAAARAGRTAAATASMLLAACGATGMQMSPVFDGGDEFETRLELVQRISPELVSMAGDDGSAPLGGTVAAVAANGNFVYFVEAESGLLVKLDLVTMTGRPLHRLADVTTRGLLVAIDGSAYILDRYLRQVIVHDGLTGDVRFLPVPASVASPADIAWVDGDRTLAVASDLDGRIALLDSYGTELSFLGPGAMASFRMPAVRAMAATHGRMYFLDEDGSEIVGVDLSGRFTGAYGSDEISHATAFAVDQCGRFFAADDVGGDLYVGFSDLFAPGFRATVPELTAGSVTDMWIDGAYLYVATQGDGILLYLVTPECRVR